LCQIVIHFTGLVADHPRTIPKTDHPERNYLSPTTIEYQMNNQKQCVKLYFVYLKIHIEIGTALPGVIIQGSI
jgi:hypothetical protein